MDSPGTWPDQPTTTTFRSVRSAVRGGSPGTWSRSSTCAFVPPNPKPDTAAVRGLPRSRGHGRGPVGTSSPVSAIRNSSGGAVNRCCGGMVSLASPSTASITDTTPAAQPVWPISDLLDVTAVGRVVPKWRRSVVNSARSPAGVPVACASTQSTSSPPVTRPASARRTARSCPSALGA